MCSVLGHCVNTLLTTDPVDEQQRQLQLRMHHPQRSEAYLVGLLLLCTPCPVSIEACFCMMQMIAEAILSPVHLPASTVNTFGSNVAAAAGASQPALLWELQHLAQSVAAGKAEEAAIRQAITWHTWLEPIFSSCKPSLLCASTRSLFSYHRKFSYYMRFFYDNDKA